MVIKNLCILVIWTKVASALEGFNHSSLVEMCRCMGTPRFGLRVVDREWALCMHHQISLPRTTISHR